MSQATQRKPVVPPAEARDAVLQAIHAADAPVTIAVLAKLPGVGKAAQVKRLLADDVAAGRLFDWGKSSYWHSDPSAIARERLLELAAREFLAKKDLTQKAAQTAPKFPPKIAQSAFQKLVDEKRFRELKTSGAKTKGVFDAQHPEPYLELEIGSILKSCGMERPAERIRALLTSDQTAGISSLPAPVTAPDVAGVAERLFAAMNRLAFAPGTTVTFQRLRQQPELAHIPKKTFDDAALLLQQDRRALLDPHGYAGAIPEQEREQLVTDGFGNYYVSIYAR